MPVAILILFEETNKQTNKRQHMDEVFIDILIVVLS